MSDHSVHDADCRCCECEYQRVVEAEAHEARISGIEEVLP